MLDSSLSIISTVLICTAFGSFGGFVAGIARPKSHMFNLPFSDKKKELGSAGDMVIGAAASLAVFSFAASISGVKLYPVVASSDLFKIISLSIVSGFVGQPLISAMSARLLEQVTKIERQAAMLETREKANEYVRLGNSYLERKTNRPNHEKFEEKVAIEYFEKAIKEDEKVSDAYIGKAKALRRIGDYAKAISTLDDLLKITPGNERALYNRTCYKAMNGNSIDEVLSDLSRAINVFPHYKKLAEVDSDFNTIRESQKFKGLIGATSE